MESKNSFEGVEEGNIASREKTRVHWSPVKNLFFLFTTLFTAITCPATMVYSECAPGCPKICKNLDMKCSTKCIPGCTCPNGQYHDGKKCVDRDQCSCYYREKRYDHGESRYEPCQVWWVKPLFYFKMFYFIQGCYRSGIGKGKNILQSHEKSGHCAFILQKLTIWRKVRESWSYNTADLIPLKASKNISGRCDLSDVCSLLKKAMFYIKVSVFWWVERTAVREGWRLLLHLKLWVYLIREIKFLSKKSQGKAREFWKVMPVATLL